MDSQESLNGVQKILNGEKLDELVLLSAWCWEGLVPSPENIEYIRKELDLVDKNVIFTCTGNLMNTHYGLTGKNAYPGDFPFVFIYDYYDVENRILYGAQWFDVIVENNLINQAFLDENEGATDFNSEFEDEENSEEFEEEEI